MALILPQRFQALNTGVTAPAMEAIFGVPSMGAVNQGTSDYTFVTRYEIADMNNIPTGTVTEVYIEFLSSLATSSYYCDVGPVYIGVAAASGDVYDFASTPTQLTFDGGSSTWSPVSASESKNTDTVSFSWDKTTDLLVALWSNASPSITSYAGANTNFTTSRSYFKAGTDDSATVDKTGYTGPGSAMYGGIRQIYMDGY